MISTAESCFPQGNLVRHDLKIGLRASPGQVSGAASTTAIQSGLQLKFVHAMAEAQPKPLVHFDYSSSGGCASTTAGIPPGRLWIHLYRRHISRPLPDYFLNFSLAKLLNRICETDYRDPALKLSSRRL